MRQTDRQTDRHKLYLVVAILIVAIGSYFGYRFIRHENNQNQRINNLEKEVSVLNDSLSILQDNINTLKDSDVEWSNDSYNYLAIGNSITKHPICNYWWNEIGMAASSEDKDYVHLISSALPQPSKVVAYNFSVWETQSHDRAETLSLLDWYLSDKLDLVTIQLSENVSDVSTFENDYVELISYVKKGAPNAQIIVIDDFWDSGEKSMMKQLAAEQENVDFVSLEDIKEKTEYQAGLGTLVYDKDGNKHIIEHEGVAVHPGDKGMEYIAMAVEKIIEKS